MYFNPSGSGGYWGFVQALLHLKWVENYSKVDIPPSSLSSRSPRVSAWKEPFEGGIWVCAPRVLTCYARELNVILRPASFYYFSLKMAEVAGNAHTSLT
jgi:hypothetical protein